MGNDMYNDEQLAHAKAMSLKNTEAKEGGER